MPGLRRLVAEQASVAMRTADAVILVVDAGVGATAADEATAPYPVAIRQAGVLGRNKVDSERPIRRRGVVVAEQVSRMRSAHDTVGSGRPARRGARRALPGWGVRVGSGGLAGPVSRRRSAPC